MKIMSFGFTDTFTLEILSDNSTLFTVDALFISTHFPFFLSFRTQSCLDLRPNSKLITHTHSRLCFFFYVSFFPEVPFDQKPPNTGFPGKKIIFVVYFKIRKFLRQKLSRFHVFWLFPLNFSKFVIFKSFLRIFVSNFLKL